jgi:uncharacterized membrane protein
MPDPTILATVASLISVFGAVMLFFRIERELKITQQNEDIWIPWADWLLIAATLTSLILVILPMVTVGPESKLVMKVSIAACSASTALVAGYILSILAHYRLLFGKSRLGARENPEPAEKLLVRLTIVVSVLLFIVVVIRSK